MTGGSRRPPLDPVNALLSFLYVLLMHSCRLCPGIVWPRRTVRISPPRPAREAVARALDLMEEFPSLFRGSPLALTCSTANRSPRRTLTTGKAGAVLLKEASRKAVLIAWQERKQDEIVHPFLEEKMTLGLLPHLQAGLLARHLRGDLDAYPAFLTR